VTKILGAPFPAAFHIGKGTTGKRVLSLLCVAMMAFTAFAAQKDSKTANRDAKPSAETDAKLPGPSAEEVKKMGGVAIDPKAYIIGAEDVLQIRVWREPELSGPISVRPDGKISMPLLGETQAAGLSPESLAAAIGNGLTKFMTHPEVTVGVTQVNSKRYFIQGEVQKPGAYPLVVPTTVLEALVNAGGFRDFANTKKIRIMRGSQVFRFNYKEVTQGKHLEENIPLQAGDQIIVP
jgi:polysaccharide export outer membrane protein